MYISLITTASTEKEAVKHVHMCICGVLDSSAVTFADCTALSLSVSTKQSNWCEKIFYWCILSFD